MDRLEVGSSDLWPKAILPAAYDWYYPSWFPRIAYLGQVPEHESPAEPVTEAARGWAPDDILDLAKGQFIYFDPRFMQGASPGMAFSTLPLAEAIRLTNMHADHQQLNVLLPRHKVQATIRESHARSEKVDAKTKAIVISPDDLSVTIVYAAVCEVQRPYGPEELEAMTWEIRES